MRTTGSLPPTTVADADDEIMYIEVLHRPPLA
jgi:hypothetical protein